MKVLLCLVEHVVVIDDAAVRAVQVDRGRDFMFSAGA